MCVAQAQPRVTLISVQTPDVGAPLGRLESVPQQTTLPVESIAQASGLRNINFEKEPVGISEYKVL